MSSSEAPLNRHEHTIGAQDGVSRHQRLTFFLGGGGRGNTVFIHLDPKDGERQGLKQTLCPKFRTQDENKHLRTHHSLTSQDYMAWLGAITVQSFLHSFSPSNLPLEAAKDRPGKNLLLS